jgi:hypothetical protein
MNRRWGLSSLSGRCGLTMNFPYPMSNSKSSSPYCYHSSRLRGGGGGGGQLRFGEMRSHPQWEYCVEVFRRQHSLYQCVPKEIRVTDFWWFISGKQVMSLIQYTVVTVVVERGKWKRSLQYHNSLLKFKFTLETLWSQILKFTIFPARLWNMIKHLARPSYINILIWTVNILLCEI